MQNLLNNTRFYKIQISLLFLIFFIGCSPKIIQHGLVSYVNSNGKETIKVKADDYGKSEKEAVANAEKLAINTLLNVGITGSEVNSPMIGINVDKTSKEEYLKKLFTNDRYRSFLTCSENVQVVKEKRVYHATLNCCISYRALRKDLEDNNIIKKLGF
jgi:hypothetical protein